jgi:hypothetical protein
MKDRRQIGARYIARVQAHPEAIEETVQPMLLRPRGLTTAYHPPDIVGNCLWPKRTNRQAAINLI